MSAVARWIIEFRPSVPIDHLDRNWRLVFDERGRFLYPSRAIAISAGRRIFSLDGFYTQSEAGWQWRVRREKRETQEPAGYCRKHEDCREHPRLGRACFVSEAQKRARPLRDPWRAKARSR